MKNRMKMKELERATGVNRETVRFYIREGLLPEPERRGRNVAFYDESFIERLELIKELKSKRFLPLSIIKSIVGSKQAPTLSEVQALMELDGHVFEGVPEEYTPEERKLSEVSERTGLSAAEILRMAEIGAIEIETTDGDQWLDDNSLHIVQIWGELRAKGGYKEELGFGPDNLQPYVDFVRWLAREELRMFAHGVAGRVTTEDSARMAESGIDGMNQIIGLMRKATLLRFIAQGNVPTGEEDVGQIRRDGTDD